MEEINFTGHQLLYTKLQMVIKNMEVRAHLLHFVYFQVNKSK